MLEEYKLVYFNLRGRGELPRLIFVAAGINFENHIVNIKMEISEEKREIVEFDDWLKNKPLSPFGKLPYLEIKTGDEVFKLSQNMAIVRYLARKFDLYGSNDHESALCDMYGGLIEELTVELGKFIWEPNYETKKVLKEKLINKDIPDCMNYFEEKLKANKTSFVVGDKLSWLDLALFRTVEILDENFLNSKQMVLDNYPSIKNNFEMISNLPNIAKWIADRPDYLY